MSCCYSYSRGDKLCSLSCYQECIIFSYFILIFEFIDSLQFQGYTLYQDRMIDQKNSCDKWVTVWRAEYGLWTYFYVMSIYKILHFDLVSTSLIVNFTSYSWFIPLCLCYNNICLIFKLRAIKSGTPCITDIFFVLILLL